jgi:phosphopantothenoylcysteine decarboxylase/phosphopantothenate--cysteine ligase
MHFLITTGPTREYLDDVRFLTNGSSGKMGVAVAIRAIRAGHTATLLAGPMEESLLADARAFGVIVVSFISVADLQAAMADHFPACDVLVMAAAVGDFTVPRQAAKMSRKAGPVTLTLEPTVDVLASITPTRRPDQRIVAFAVEAGTEAEMETKARAELAAKGADVVVLNTPAAMGADDSLACILDAKATVLPWATRSKNQLAKHIVETACR